MNPVTAQGFSQGLLSGLESIRRRKIEDQQLANQADELAYRRQRRAVVDSQADQAFQANQQELTNRNTEFQQSQQDRVVAKAKAQRDALSSAEHAGMQMVTDALASGADPEVVRQRYNQQVGAVGGRQIASLGHDAKTGAITMTGEQGGQFTGSLDQFRAIYGTQKQPGKLTAVARTSRLYETDASGNTKKVADVDPSVIAADKARAAKKNSADGGRKLSSYNPEGKANSAATSIRSYYKGSRDPLGNWTFDNASDQERAQTAEAYASNFFASKGLDGQKYGVGEVADLAKRAADSRISAAEAKDQVKKAGYREGTPEFKTQMDNLIRASDKRSKTIWNQGINSLEQNRKSGGSDMEQFFMDDSGGSGDELSQDQLDARDE